MAYNKQKLYKSIMENVAKTVKRSLNEAGRQHLNLHGDFGITQDSQTADSYKAFLRAAFSKKQLSIEDEVKLSDIIQNSDNPRDVQRAKDTLVTHNLAFVVSVVNKYSKYSKFRNSSLSTEDLIQIGNEAMIEAAGNYKPNPENPERFVSYAVWTIRRDIINALDAYSGVVRKTKNAGYIVRASQRFIERYESENGYAPSIEEIFKELKKDRKFETLTLNTLQQALKSDQYSTSLDATMSNDDDSKSSVGDNMENRTFNAPDSGIENEELERELENALYRVLSKRDADIICNFYGIAGRRAMSVGELADIYNLTDTRINQIRRSAEEKMRNDDETVELLQYLNA